MKNRYQYLNKDIRLKYKKTLTIRSGCLVMFNKYALMPSSPLSTGMSSVLFYFGYTLKRSARLIGYFILDFYYWCNLDYHFSREKIAALLTPVCAEMTKYDRALSNLRRSTCRINSGLSAQCRLSCIHLKCPFTAKMDISSGNRKGRW